MKDHRHPVVQLQTNFFKIENLQVFQPRTVPSSTFFLIIWEYIFYFESDLLETI